MLKTIYYKMLHYLLKMLNAIYVQGAVQRDDGDPRSAGQWF